jgi:hypothetical protein
MEENQIPAKLKVLMDSIMVGMKQLKCPNNGSSMEAIKAIVKTKKLPQAQFLEALNACIAGKRI